MTLDELFENFSKNEGFEDIDVGDFAHDLFTMGRCADALYTIVRTGRELGLDKGDTLVTLLCAYIYNYVETIPGEMIIAYARHIIAEYDAEEAPSGQFVEIKADL